MNFKVRSRSFFDYRVGNAELAMRFTRSRMCSALYSARSEIYPTIPKSLVYLGVLLGSPQLRSICKTADGEDYIFQGVVGCEQLKTAAVVFVSGRMLQFLQTRESIHVDGTFKKRPKKPRVMQIFNISAKHGDNVSVVILDRYILYRCVAFNSCFCSKGNWCGESPHGSAYYTSLCGGVQLFKIDCAKF